ncbi:hypothetical protein [Nocardioides sp. AE5]|uniref:hypothetical protein n=1 Tax=Nocardioides sp. AE5 TaxID=2962573 RepID=UPI002881C3D9|nr:hypothetical protein [Nocardioides sp. AE5]MDT0203423.1 hypothetical protein [Nocardioides sp. AE5]
MESEPTPTPRQPTSGPCATVAHDVDAQACIDTTVVRTLLCCVFGWQAVMVIAILDATTRIPAPLLLTAHALLALVTLATAQRRAPVLAVALAAPAVVLLDVGALTEVEGPLALATAWWWLLCCAVPLVLARATTALVAGACGLIAVPVGTALLHPAWETWIPIAMVVVGLITATVARVGVRIVRHAVEHRQLPAALGLAWGGAVILLGLVVESVHRPGALTAVHAALATLAGLCLLAWAGNRRGAPLHPVIPLVTMACTPVVFVLGFIAVELGRGDLLAWQVLLATVPPALLLPNATSPAPFRVALVALGCIAVLMAGAMAVDDTGPSAILPFIGVASPLALLASWAHVDRALGTLATVRPAGTWSGAAPRPRAPAPVRPRCTTSPTESTSGRAG